MKRKNGITLISLIITIIIIVILAGVSLTTGIDSMKKARMTRFNAEMKVIHTTVNELIEEMSLEELNQLGEPAVSKVSEEKAIEIGISYEALQNLRYFDKAGLESLGIANIDREVIINFSTRNVFDLEGVETDAGTRIYTLEEWINNAYLDVNREAPTFSLRKKINGLNATIFVENIQYKGNVTKGTITYCLTDDNYQEGTWHQVSGTQITVSTTGTYKVKITDAAGNYDTRDIDITLANKPLLEDGMTPVVYNSTSEDWDTINPSTDEWYDYSSYYNSWARAQDENGDIWMWIPRLIYKQGTRQVKFLIDKTNVATDNTNETISNTNNSGTWALHKAFQRDITGVWTRNPSSLMMPAALLDTVPIPYTIPEVIEAGIAKGDTVNWTPNGTYKWEAKYYSSDTETYEDLYFASGSEYTENNVNMTISQWKVLKIDELNKKIIIIPVEATTAMARLHGPQGYNNGVKLLNDACSSLYGNYIGVEARSINMIDMEGPSGDGSDGMMSADTSKITQAKGRLTPIYGEKHTTGKITYRSYGTDENNIGSFIEDKYYPTIYEEEALREIDNIYSANGIKMSEARNEFINGEMPWKVASRCLHPTQTYYYLSESDFNAALGSTNQRLIVSNKWRSFWVASRCIYVYANNCGYGIRRVSRRCA